ncbi:MAG: carboxyltransferase domain-containing protein, partial [Mycobacterium sp.]
MSVATDLSVLDYGDHALLLECGSTAEVLAWTAALREADLNGVTDIVPASRTVMVKLAAARHLSAARQHIETLDVGPDDDMAAAAGPNVVIEVAYDGEDLEVVGRITGLGAAGV